MKSGCNWLSLECCINEVDLLVLQLLHFVESVTKFFQADIILTNYNMIGSKGDDRRFFRRFKFNYVVYDEGHLLKNCSTDRYRNLMKLSVSARYQSFIRVLERYRKSLLYKLLAPLHIVASYNDTISKMLIS